MEKKGRRLRAAGMASILLAAFPFASLASAETGWTESGKLYEIRTWAGQAEWGNEDGAVREATLLYPHSVAQLADGRLLVAEAGNHLLRVLTTDQVATYGGLIVGEDELGLPVGGYNDDNLPNSAFQQPSGLAVDAAGTIYVADAGNNAIRKISADGTVSTLAGNGLIGKTDGQGEAARFYHPSDVAVDASGNVYVADTLNHVIRKIDAEGNATTLTAESTRTVQMGPGTIESSGDYMDGAIAEAKFNEPSGLAIDAKGNLYVSDRGNQRIRYIDFAAGTVTTVAGTAPAYAADSLYAEGEFADGDALAARFYAPEGLAVAPDGTLVIADSLNHAIRLLKDGVVATLAGEGAEFGANDGVTYAAHFNRPTDVAILKDGRLAIADESGNKIRLLAKYRGAGPAAADGTVTTLLDGSPVRTDAAAYVQDGAVLLPLRSVGEALGYEVGYDGQSKTGKLSKESTTYEIKLGEKTVSKTADGLALSLELNGAPVFKDGRMFVPVRFFAAEADLDIQWDGTARTVVIRHKSFEGGAAQ